MLKKIISSSELTKTFTIVFISFINACTGKNFAIQMLWIIITFCWLITFFLELKDIAQH